MIIEAKEKVYVIVQNEGYTLEDLVNEINLVNGKIFEIVHLKPYPGKSEKELLDFLAKEETKAKEVYYSLIKGLSANLRDFKIENNTLKEVERERLVAKEKELKEREKELEKKEKNLSRKKIDNPVLIDLVLTVIEELKTTDRSRILKKINDNINNNIEYYAGHKIHVISKSSLNSIIREQADYLINRELAKIDKRGIKLIKKSQIKRSEEEILEDLYNL